MRLIRWGPMAAADFVAEFFETDLLRAAVAARGIFGAALGPWSAGSTLLLLLRAAADPYPAGSSAYPARRHGRSHRGDGCGREGSRRGNSHQRRSRRKFSSNTAPSPASSSRAAKKFPRRPSCPAPTRSRTFLGLLDPVHLPPSFVVKMQQFPRQRHGRETKYCARRASVVHRAEEFQRYRIGEQPRRPHPHRPRHRLSRARL